MIQITNARELHNRVREFLADDSVSLEACRDAMHAMGILRYESLTSESVGDIADIVAGRLEIPEARLSALSAAAAEAGDMEMVQVCDAALMGDQSAMVECLRTLRAAEAQR